MRDMLSTSAALSEVKHFADQAAQGNSLIADLPGLLAAAQVLADAVERVRSQSAGSIVTDDFLTRYCATAIDPEACRANFDTYTFYQGVSFALAKVHQALRGPV
jgi:hypothetical protein